MSAGDPVFIAEYGFGARPARVVRCYEKDGRSRVVVSIEGQKALRDCFVESVFLKRAQAQRASEW